MAAQFVKSERGFPVTEETGRDPGEMVPNGGTYSSRGTIALQCSGGVRLCPTCLQPLSSLSPPAIGIHPEVTQRQYQYFQISDGHHPVTSPIDT